MSNSPSPSSPSPSPQQPQQQNPSIPSSPPTAIPVSTAILSLQAQHQQPLSNSPPNKKPQPIPWTHEETLNLIQAYQEKWYSLKRGQLKASQWEEVAITVAARCGLDEPSKSATQCRHKMEKLRKRYRAEKTKPFTSGWVYFPLMEQLEHGPLPISAVAPVQQVDVLESDDDFGGDLGHGFFGNRKNFDGFLRDGGKMGSFGDGYRNFGGQKRKYWEEENEEEEEEMIEDEEREKEVGNDEKYDKEELLGELATQMRGFAERFVKVEKKKMEIMRETERFRMEMENKRLEMILVSQQKTVDMISKIFGSSQRR